MKNLILLFSLFLLVSCATVEKDADTPATSSPTGPNQPETFTPAYQVPEVDGSYYYQALKLLKSEQLEMLSMIDFVKFRYAYLKVRDQDQLSIPTQLRENLRLSIEKEDHMRTILYCEEILKYDFTDIYVHILRNFFLERTGKDMTFYKVYVNKLVDSIFDSGDGHTPETAFHVTQIKEEYEILKFMGLNSRTQMLMDQGGHSFDVLTCENGNGETVEVYFDITEHMQALSQQFSGE